MNSFLSPVGMRSGTVTRINYGYDKNEFDLGFVENLGDALYPWEIFLENK